MLLNLIRVGYYDHVIVHGSFLFVVHYYDLNLVLYLDHGLFPFLDLVPVHGLDPNNDPILVMTNNWMTIDGYVMMMMGIEIDHHHSIVHHNLDHFVRYFFHIDRTIEMILCHNHHNKIAVNVYGCVHHNPGHMVFLVDPMDVVEYPNLNMDENRRH